MGCAKSKMGCAKSKPGDANSTACPDDLIECQRCKFRGSLEEFQRHCKTCQETSQELPHLPSVVKRMVPRVAYPGPRPLKDIPATPTHEEFNDPEIQVLVERFGIDFSHAATYKRVFRELDTKITGSIPRKDLKRLLTKAGARDVQKVVDIFHAADKTSRTKNKEITLEDFVAVMSAGDGITVLIGIFKDEAAKLSGLGSTLRQKDVVLNGFLASAVRSNLFGVSLFAKFMEFEKREGDPNRSAVDMHKASLEHAFALAQGSFTQVHASLRAYDFMTAVDLLRRHFTEVGQAFMRIVMSTHVRIFPPLTPSVRSSGQHGFLGPARFTFDGVQVERTELSATTPSGMTLEASWWRPKLVVGESPCVIFAHTYWGGRYCALEILSACLMKGFSVLAPDLSGCGSSEGHYTGLGARESVEIQTWCDQAFTAGAPCVLLWGVGLGAIACLEHAASASRTTAIASGSALAAASALGSDAGMHLAATVTRTSSTLSETVSSTGTWLGSSITGSGEEPNPDSSTKAEMSEAANDPTLRASNALNSLRPNASAETIATAAAAAENYGNIAGCVLDHCPADTCAEVESYILSFQPAWDKHVLPKAGIGFPNTPIWLVLRWLEYLGADLSTEKDKRDQIKAPGANALSIRPVQYAATLHIPSLLVTSPPIPTEEVISVIQNPANKNEPHFDEAPVTFRDAVGPFLAAVVAQPAVDAAKIARVVQEAAGSVFSNPAVRVLQIPPKSMVDELEVLDDQDVPPSAKNFILALYTLIPRFVPVRPRRTVCAEVEFLAECAKAFMTAKGLTWTAGDTPVDLARVGWFAPPPWCPAEESSAVETTHGNNTRI